MIRWNLAHGPGFFLHLVLVAGCTTAAIRPVTPCDPADPFDCSRRGREARKAKDLTGARNLVEHGCNHDNLNACVTLGGLRQELDEPIASIEAPYRKACAGGHRFACVQWGNLYWAGRRVPQDLNRARELFERACGDIREVDTSGPWDVGSIGQAYGCDNLSALYEQALGVAQDKAKAVELVRFACAQGWGNSCNQVGVFIGRGWITDARPGDELAYYLKGCELVTGVACCNAARTLEQTHGHDAAGRDAAHYRGRAAELQYPCTD